ncbi:MAG: DNA-binding response regulator [Bacillota bacterium]
MHQIRMFVMCDSQVVRSSLSIIFTSDNNFTVIGQEGCSDESVSKAQNLQPDAILCKISPEDGLKWIRQIKEACPYTKVFSFIDEDLAGESYIEIASEVDGCLSRAMLPHDLVKTVELTCRTGVLCLPAFLKGLLWGNQCKVKSKENSPGCEPSNNNKGSQSSLSNPTLPLTTREMEIYKLITQNCSNKEIGEKLYISQPTVKSHVSSILRKLGLPNRTQLVLYEMQNRSMH